MQAAGEILRILSVDDNLHCRQHDIRDIRAPEPGETLTWCEPAECRAEPPELFGFRVVCLEVRPIERAAVVVNLMIGRLLRSQNPQVRHQTVSSDVIHRFTSHS
jgi:hypothetical protein